MELNEKYEMAHRPDIIVVLDVGVINYTAQFVGARNMGDFAVAADDEFIIPPCYVHLVAREDGAFSLNRLFTHLLSHLARGSPDSCQGPQMKINISGVVRAWSFFGGSPSQ